MLKYTTPRQSDLTHFGYHRLESKISPKKHAYFGIVKKAWLRLCFSQPTVAKLPKPVSSPPTPPPPSPLTESQRLLIEALESSGRKEKTALCKWKLAKKSCEKLGIPFKQAMDSELPIGATALRRLVDATDHASLRFVHSNLPAGSYSGGVYLGPYKGDCTKPPSRVDRSYESNRPIYRGEMSNLQQFCGYGVVDWVDYKSYVGEWSSAFNFEPERRVVERWCWMQDGAEQLFLMYQVSPSFEVKMASPRRLPYKCRS